MDTRTIPEREYLLRAFNSFRASRPQFWGDDLDAALAHPTKRIAIVQVAKHMQAGTPPDSAEKPRNLVVKPIPFRHLPAGVMDFKSLAAGERTDREDD